MSVGGHIGRVEGSMSANVVVGRADITSLMLESQVSW